MAGHGDIGQMAVHPSGRQHKGSVHGRALALMDRRRIAVIERGILIGRDCHNTTWLALFLAIQPDNQPVRLGLLYGAQQAVFYAHRGVVFEKYETIPNRK